MKSRPARLASLALAALVPASVHAQQPNTWELGVQIMGTPDASRPDLFFGGQAVGIRQSALAIRATKDLLRVGPARLRYSAQLLPAVVLSGTERYQKLDVGDGALNVVGGTTRTFGIGLVPIGLDLSVDLGSRFRTEIGAAAGIMRFSRNIPLAGSRQRNFTAEGDATVMMRAGNDRWLELGLRFKHISNGFTAYENPRIDNRLIFAGIRTRLGARR